MVFVVKKIKSEECLQACSVGLFEQKDQVQSVDYPSSKPVRDDDETVASSLLLLHVDKARSSNWWEALKSLFSHESVHTEYRVVLYQNHPAGYPQHQAFVLFRSDHSEEKAENAFDDLHMTLKPLIQHGRLKLTKPLLKELVLPSPVKVHNLSAHLVNLAETKPEVHHEWPKILSSVTGQNVPGGVISALVTSSFTFLPKHIYSGNFLHQAANEDQIDSIWAMIDKEELKKCNRECMRSSKKLRNTINECDTEGCTPLLRAVNKQFVNSALYLLVGGALPTTAHRETGDTPLHIAAKKSNETLVKLLLVFGADPECRNNNNDTPLQIVTDLVILKILKTAAEKRKTSVEFFANSPSFSIPTEKKKGKYLVCADGGGVRSNISCQVLLAIEERMKELQPNCSPLMHYFQHMSGTSAGALGVMLFAYKDMSIAGCRALNFRFATQVLAKPLSVREKTTNNYLMDVFGKDLTITSITSPRVTVTTTIADINPPQLFLIRNYKPPYVCKQVACPWKVWEAGRATSAAPVFFPSYSHCDRQFLDGGLMANNPTLDTLAEVLSEEGCSTVPACVLSLGSGITEPQQVDNVELFFENYFEVLAKPLQTLQSARSILELFVAQVTQSDGQEVRRARAWCKSIGVPYYRFSPELSTNISPAETNLSVLIDLLYDTQLYIWDNHSMIDDVARLILQGTPSPPS